MTYVEAYLPDKEIHEILSLSLSLYVDNAKNK
jgi:hypothetical protein